MKFCVLGHRGMVGSALVRAIAPEIPLVSNIDLTDRVQTRRFVQDIMGAGVETLFCAAGRVGGIQRNIDEPAQMLRENLLIALNVAEMCQSAGVKLAYLGSSCIYPRECPQPMKEEYLLTGPLEPTNEPYALAKIAGIKLCESYARQYRLKTLMLMPCNLYGPRDRFCPRTGHMVAALIRRFVEAAESGAESVTVWGTGTPRRECMHVDDFALAALWLVNRSATGLINVGTGVDFTIADIARQIAWMAGYEGTIVFDSSKPDGMPRKLLDVTRLREYRWDAARTLAKGIEDTVKWYKENRV